MTSEPTTDRRATRLENDVESIYEILTDINGTLHEHTLRFEQIDGRLDGIDGRLDAMDSRFDAMDSRFDGVEVTLVEVLRRLPEPS